MLIGDFAVYLQVWRSLWMEQSHHLCTQHPQWTTVDRTLRGDHHQKHKEQRLPLQTYLCQGKHLLKSVWRRFTCLLWLLFICCWGKLSLRYLSFRETTGALMWMRFKDLWWIKKGKWSTGCLENGTRVFTAVSHLLPNVSGGQVSAGPQLDFTRDLKWLLVVT